MAGAIPPQAEEWGISRNTMMKQISCAYAVKHLASGAGRIYITMSSIFEVSGLLSLGHFSAVYGDNEISITPNSLGSMKLMNTGRGRLLELKNQATSNALKLSTRVLVIAKKGLIKILPHPVDALKNKREKLAIGKLQNGKALSSGSLYTGLGLLNLHLKCGMARAGVNTSLKFVNDICPVALDVNCRTNPIWNDADRKAVVINDDIRYLTYHDVPQCDILDVSFVCNGQSTLVPKEMRDTKHPVVGTLFMPTVEAIKRINPAVIVFECTPAFLNSDSLSFIERELTSYTWFKATVNGHDHGEIDQRTRAVVVAISSGLVTEHIDVFSVPAGTLERPTLGEFLEPDCVKETDWKAYDHVSKKLEDNRLNFKHNVYDSSATSISTLVATYACPKVGSPFVAHPTDKNLMRMIQPPEHCNIRRVPPAMKKAIVDIAEGRSALTSKRGSKSLAHKLLGMSVSKFPWEAVGEWIGTFLTNAAFYLSFRQM